MRKIVRLFPPLLLFVLVAGCARAHLYEPSAETNPCPHAKSGLTCIDPISLAADPDPVHVRNGQYVHFFVKGNQGQLLITLPGDAPFDDQGHVGAHAWAHAKKGSKGTYKYSITLNGKTVDPTIIIDY